MLIVVGLALWAGIGAILGLTVKSTAFAEGWAEAATDQQSTEMPEPAAVADQSDRRLLVTGIVSAVVAGLLSMVVIIGETVVGLLVSLLVAAIGAAAVLLVVTAMGLSAETERDLDDDQIPFDQ